MIVLITHASKHNHSYHVAHEVGSRETNINSRHAVFNTLCLCRTDHVCVEKYCMFVEKIMIVLITHASKQNHSYHVAHEVGSRETNINSRHVVFNTLCLCRTDHVCVETYCGFWNKSLYYFNIRATSASNILGIMRSKYIYDLSCCS
jgi:hypothetical protein